MATQQQDLKRLRQLLGRPLLEDEADELAAIAKHLGITLHWQTRRLREDSWTDGRGKDRDEQRM